MLDSWLTANFASLSDALHRVQPFKRYSSRKFVENEMFGWVKARIEGKTSADIVAWMMERLQSAISSCEVIVPLSGVQVESELPIGHATLKTFPNRGRLAAESRAALRAISLRFHDLRRQFACTLLESSADLHDVRDFLGHADIRTTGRYLASSPMRLEKALARLEGTIRTPFAQPAPAPDQPDSDDASKLLN